MTHMINRLATFEIATDKIGSIIRNCKTVAETGDASKCIDHYEALWKGYSGDEEKEQVQRFRDELCYKTFDLFIETRDKKMNITTIS